MTGHELGVGCRTIAAHDSVQGARVPVHVLYPTAAPPQPHAFGAYTLDVAVDAALEGTRLPLVLIPHGTGGTPWAYRGLATHLVAAGYVVALLEHPGNSRRDDALAGTSANLANRPRHVHLAIDAVFATPAISPHLVPASAAVIGHSLGGYTALAVAGGHPMALPNETPDGVARAIPVERDPRVRAIVLLAPALPWFMGPGALADVAVPVMARLAERDEHLPPAFLERILAGLPAAAPLDCQVVPGAGHFAFFAPVPSVLLGLPPSIDPPGFDRTAYQPQLYGEVVAFLRATLAR